MDEIIQTIKQNCRRCYSCVRECPVKAIRIVDGQASVVHERCIACGNCTVVCSQNAKAYRSGLERTEALLSSGRRVAALVAPSFPAAFTGVAPGQLVTALRRVGFSLVIEVAHGADLVGQAYRSYLETQGREIRIATACPAVIEYVRKYNPDLTDCLIPIVSPMIATALATHDQHGVDVACVFIGPCVAKKLEARDPNVPQVIDEVLTFQEAQRFLQSRGIQLANLEASRWDPPEASLGRIFPLPGGLLKCAGLHRNPLDPSIVVTSGQAETLEVLSNLEKDDPQALLVEPLMCRGCQSGPGMGDGERRLMRKKRIADYVNASFEEVPEHPEVALTRRTWSSALFLGRSFRRDDQRLKEPSEEEIRVILARTNKFSQEDQLNCGACGYPTCRAKAIAVYRGLAEEAMCLPFMVEQAERVCHELKVPWQELREIHRHIINTEKLASMGQMAAGVAHELNNPLGTILLYTSILGRKLKERGDLKHDLDLLVAEANRCKKIIGNLLDFARQNRVHLEPTRLEELVRRAVDESMYAAQLSGRQVRIEVEVPHDLEADMDRDQMGQVLVNLIKNGIEAMDGKGGTVRVTASALPDAGRIRLSVSDEGCGIPPEARDKVFQPFFTTKSIGKGTGLGLPISYGIVKMHRGTIWFDTEMGKGTTFIIDLPKAQTATARSMIT